MIKWKILLYLILTYIGLVIDGSTGLKLNFLLVVLIILSLREARWGVIVFGFASGFLLDCFYPRLFGLNALLFATTGYLLGSIGERIYTNRVHLIAGIIFTTSLAYLSVYTLGSSFRTFPSIIYPTILETAFYNTVIGILLFCSTSKLCLKTP